MHHFARNIFRLDKNSALVAVTTSVILILSVVQCQGQDSSIAPKTRQEVWPEINFHYRFNDKFRLLASASGTQLKSSTYTDGGLAINLDYFALPIWRKAKEQGDSARGNLLWLRGGFYYSTSPKDADNPFHEYSIRTEVNARFHLPYGILLIDNNRFDWRFREGDFLARYRPKLTVQRDFKTDFLTFNIYMYAEYFINFIGEANNRLRTAIGSELRVAKHLNFEVYFVHQFDGDLDIISVNAIGLKLKIYWHKGDRLFPKKKSNDTNN